VHGVGSFCLLPAALWAVPRGAQLLNDLVHDKLRTKSVVKT
jgi:hypothetical protein